MVRVTKSFPGVPDGEIYPKTFDVGDELTGNLARLAVIAGNAVDDSAKGSKGSKSGAGQTAKPANGE